MRIFLIISLLLISSCTSLNNFILKAQFEDMLQNSTEVSKGLKSTTNIEKVEIVRAKDVKNLVDILTKFQAEMSHYYPLAITKSEFCYGEKLLVSEDSLRDFAKSKNYEFVLYLEAQGIKKYTIRKDNLGKKIESIKIEKSNDCSLFEAYFFSKDVTEINPVETIRY